MKVAEKSASAKLVHSLRNSVGVLQGGLNALQESRTDECVFNDVHAAMTQEIERLMDQLEEVARLLGSTKGPVDTAAASMSATPQASTHAGNAAIRVLAVDDMSDILAMVRLILDGEHGIECVGALASADNLVEEARKARAGIVVLGSNLQGHAQFEAMCELTAMMPEARVIVYSGHDDPEFIERAMACGAWGRVSKHDHPETIVAAVREIAAGRTFFQKRSGQAG